jgi:hypothetical protein
MFNKILKTMGLIALGAIIAGAGILIGVLVPGSLAVGIGVIVGGVVGGGAAGLVSYIFSTDEQKKDLDENEEEVKTFQQRRLNNPEPALPADSSAMSQKLDQACADIKRIEEENIQLKAKVNALELKVENQGRDLSHGTIASEKNLRQKQPSVFDSNSASPPTTGLNPSPKV